jgi:glycerophosphoryl diester phosphodiesterase
MLSKLPPPPVSLLILLALAPPQLSAEETAPATAAARVKQIVAHRGASAERPENTLAAIRRAIEVGATAVEMDVRTTKDGHLVLSHDAALDRMTDGQGEIGDKTLAEIQSLDAGAKFSPQFRGERVPTLQQGLAVCRGKIDVLLDLKEAGDQYAARIAAAVKEAGEEPRIIVGVRGTDQAAQYRKLLPKARLLGLIGKPDEIEAYARAGVETIRLWPRWLTDKTLVPKVRASGCKLHLNGTSGAADEVLALLAYEPDSLSSDHPARLVATLAELRAGRVSLSGIYPQLAMFNSENECGTGAVVPWADRLWVITYGPHLPKGSSDKLYEIDSALAQTIRPESVGGTPASRLIHSESGQLFIGPYAIDAERRVRVIPPSVMPGRLTGAARHLTDPAGKIYYATMEEGFYEVDVKTLAVKELYRDANSLPNHAGVLLPGYHGKGLYSGGGRLVYANNGELSSEAQRRPDIPSGVLAEWAGQDWTVVRRNQFTEVTGPGGIEGNKNATDPVWSVGWDHRSLILMLLDGGKWHAFRLPKASHSYDGAHGWNTEWPRIRDIGPAGQADLLMTMHGTFWRFPQSFSAANTAGIAPRSNYLKVVGDFCRWQDRIVLGCDDTAKSEFLNKRKVKGTLAGPGRSQSNLWFVESGQLDRLGPVLGRGAVWLNDAVKAGEPSDPYLFAGYERRAAHLAHSGDTPVKFTIEVDRDGNGTWQPLRDVTVPPRGSSWVDFAAGGAGQWIRLRTDRDSPGATAFFQYSNADPRTSEADAIFAGLATPMHETYHAGLLRARGDERNTLSLAAAAVEHGKIRAEGYYEMDADLVLRRVENAKDHAWLKENAAVPAGVLEVDAASVLVTDDAGRRWRLPKGDAALGQRSPVPSRVAREVCTERDLLNAHGTFYELPAENAGGFARLRPIATHNQRITDYASWRGLLVLSGLVAEPPRDNPHVIRSDDGLAAVWVGAVDDLWKLGKPVGQGGPWKDTAVRAGEPSDPYLLTGYDKKALTLSHDAKEPVTIRVEIDVSGTGLWQPMQEFVVPAGRELRHDFPAAYAAYWLRVIASRDCRATAWLVYE